MKKNIEIIIIIQKAIIIIKNFCLNENGFKYNINL